MKGTSAILATAIALAVTQAHAIELNDEAQKVGYSIGVDLGGSLKQLTETNGKDSVNVDAVVAGLKDALADKKLSMTPEEMKNTMMSFAEKSMNAMKDKMEKEAVANAEAGKAFLEKNAKADGVKQTKSGLQYKVIKEGKGAKPTPSDEVTVTYQGTLIDGTVFDSTEKNGGQPVSFKLDQVIPGWVEGLQLMNEGSEYTFYIPSDLAYGKQGAGPVIPPNSTLIFDVTLEKVSPESVEKTK